MKQSASFVFFYFILFPAWAQFTDNTKVIGTNFQFYTIKTVHEDTRFLESLTDQSTSFSFRPYYGKVNQQNKMSGVSIGYTRMNVKKYEIESDIVQSIYRYVFTEKGNHFSANGFMRFYKFPISNVGVFLQLSGEFGYGNYDIQRAYIESENNPLKHLKTDFYDFSLISNLGAVYRVNEWLGLELNYGNFGFTYLISNVTDVIRNSSEIQKNKTSGLGFDFGTSTIFIGANFYLTPKSEEE